MRDQSPQAEQKGMLEKMAFYEHVFIVRPDMSPAQVDALHQELKTFLGTHDAKVGKTEYWGLQTLAYPVDKQRKGHYSLFNIEASGEAVHELERRHRISSEVMRYLTVRTDHLDEEPSAMMSRANRSVRRDSTQDTDSASHEEANK